MPKHESAAIPAGKQKITTHEPKTRGRMGGDGEGTDMKGGGKTDKLKQMQAGCSGDPAQEPVPVDR